MRRAEEVRYAAALASVCRRVRALLRAHPLPLALDFSAAPLSRAQRHWLLEPVQAGRVEAAKFSIDEGEDALWDQRVIDVFLARHSGTLLQLSSVPLRLVAGVAYEERPALDLSGLRLTKLGIACSGVAGLVYSDNGPVDRGEDEGPAPSPVWLWPECLPGALEELELLGLHGDYLQYLAWAPESKAGLAMRLPWLHTIRMTCKGAEKMYIHHAALLDGFLVLPAFTVDGWNGITVHPDLFGRVRSVRIEAGADVSVQVWGARDQATVALIVDRLCSAGLQAADLCGEEYVMFKQIGFHECGDSVVTREVVHDMISRFGDRFAVDVDGPDEPSNKGSWDKSVMRRLAWRRWPAPGAPGLQAAIAHERARAWAAEAAHD
jgi:hypothetical protein